MNYTKEYIKEADCKAIQNLKDLNDLDHGDWVYYKDDEFDEQNCSVYLAEPFSFMLNSDIWIPTGDQLDEEIIKIVKKDKQSFYEFYYEHTYKDYYKATFSTTHPIISPVGYISTNPLIAKIKLLKALLKESNDGLDT